MHATRPACETQLSLTRPTEINLSFSTTWMQDKDLCVDEDHSAWLLPARPAYLCWLLSPAAHDPEPCQLPLFFLFPRRL